MWNPQVPLPETPKDPPNIFQFLDYREFLRQYLRYKKDILPGFSLGVFSKRCGFGSKSFLQFVLANKRNISMASCDRLIRALKLTHEEAIYFRLLVQENQELDAIQKAGLAQELNRQRELYSCGFADEIDETLSSHWIIPSVRRLAQLNHFEKDPSWIQKHFTMAVSDEQISLGLKALHQTAEADISEQFEVDEQRLQYCRQIVQVANTILLQRNDLSNAVAIPLTLTMDPEMFLNLKTEILEFRQKIYRKYGSSRVSDTQVFHFTLLCLPVTRAPQK